MEKKIIFTLAFLAVVFAFPVSAYYVETHAFLTQKTVEFFNKNSNQQISDEFIPYLIDGTRREDDVPRWMNHFYDPIYNRGLTYDPAINPSINFGTWKKSKDWANDEEGQNNLKYKVPATIASILTAFQQKKLNAISDETNYTWNKALRLYIKGDKEKAMFVLGHVIHLIQDASVPDHTRNDPHPSGSVYEVFSKKNLSVDSQLENKTILSRVFLEDYFNELARYSNNNFYSADTIGIQSGFSKPEPTEFENKNGYLFGVNNNDGFYYLFKKEGTLSGLTFLKGEVSLSDDIVQTGYWNRLAPKAVQYSASVIDLFFKEAERLKNDKEFFAKKDKSLFASLLDSLREAAQKSRQTLREFFLGNQEQYHSLMLADIEDLGESIQIEEELKENDTPVQEPIKKEEILILSDSPTSTIVEEATSSEPIVLGTSTETNATTTVPVATKSTLGQFALRINEIMYDALGNDDKREWVEIYHEGGDAVDLTQLSFLEGGTKHRIEALNGSSIIPQYGYAILADDPTEFLKEYKDFSGILLKSSMSLSNKGEELALVAGDRMYTSMRYDPSSGGNGNGMSLQYVNGKELLQSVPTPGRENVIFFSGGGGGGTVVQSQPQSSEPQPPPIDESTTTAVAVRHIMISEILFNAEGSDDGKEFIELYNPSPAPVNLDNWALKYKTDTSETENSIISFNAGKDDQTVIPGNGYLLVGLSNYESENYSGRAADARRSRSLPNGSSRVHIVLYNSEDTPIDDLFYDESSIANDGESIERRAIEGGVCYVPQRSFEYAGNGCDSGASWDFVRRTIPLPQNSTNLIEPRPRLTTPFPAAGKMNIAEYIASSIGIGFNWTPVTPNTLGGKVWYRIDEIKNGVPSLFLRVDTTDGLMQIKEVGRNYDFEIVAEDEEGYASEPGKYSLAVPSFFDRASVYADPREGGEGKFLIDLYYDAFPFFPSIFRRNAWQGLVFYKNREPNQGNLTLSTENGFLPPDSDGVLEIIYPRCYGASEKGEQSFIFSLGSEWCVYPAGGLHSSSLDRSQLEDNHLLIPVVGGVEPFSLSDYFTVGFYDFSDSGAGRQILSLAAVDLTRWLFERSPSQQHPPVLNGFLLTGLDPVSSRLNLSFPSVSDLDTLDGKITWETNYSPLGEMLDEFLWTPSETGRTVAPGDTFFIGVRAKDDFGNYSETATVTWGYPTTTIYISQIEQDGWSGEFGTVPQNGRWLDPDTAVFQSFSPEEDFSFDFVTLKFRQELIGDQQQPSDPANLHLLVFGAKEDGLLDTDILLGTAYLNLYNPSPEQEQTFSFDVPISVEKDKTYWFALDIYYGPGHFRNRWRITTKGGDLYSRGQAGEGYGEGSSGLGPSAFSISQMTNADWYFKIGKKISEDSLQ